MGCLMIYLAQKSLNLLFETGWAYIDTWSVDWSVSYMRESGVIVGILRTL